MSLNIPILFLNLPRLTDVLYLFFVSNLDNTKETKSNLGLILVRIIWVLSSGLVAV